MCKFHDRYRMSRYTRIHLMPTFNTLYLYSYTYVLCVIHYTCLHVCTQCHAEKNDVFSGLLKKYNLNTAQLDSEIKQETWPIIAGILDNVEFYLDVLRNMTRHGNHVAMITCLSVWKNHATSSATYRALLDVIVRG